MSTRTRAVSADELFTTDTAGLTEASTPQLARLGDGDRFDLRIAPVANRIGDDVVRMLRSRSSMASGARQHQPT